MATSAEMKVQNQILREQLLADNRAKFSKNRVVYVTPNGFHTVHDIENINELADSLKKAGFEARSTTARGKFTTTDWFKCGENDAWESYVITKS